MSIGASVSVSNPSHSPSLPGDLALLDQHQVLDADAVGAGLVVAGLVREDHAGEQLLLGPGLPAARLGDALRAFVDREEAADAVAGAVRVIDARFPQELPRQRVELRAGRALAGRSAWRGAMWPLSTRVKRSFTSAGGSPGPIHTVRVMSVVPSGYCPPESTR